MKTVTEHTRPSPGAIKVVELAALALPRGDIRRRYEREFVAELYGLDRAHQARHALGVLVSVWSLRGGVTTDDYTLLEEAMGHVTERRPLMCRLNLRHHWQRGQTEDGSRYTYCARCDKIRDKGGPASAGVGSFG
ncbi:MAG: hypothetical protein ACXV3S_07085 [Kineosporiaceae bacterium]